MSNMTDKYQFINQAIFLFDENERLRAENAKLQQLINNATDQNSVPQTETGTAIKFAKAHIYEAGRVKIANDAVSYWKKVQTENKNGETIAESYDKWSHRVIENNKIPSWCSRNTFMQLFGDLFEDIYAQEKIKALTSDDDE